MYIGELQDDVHKLLIDKGFDHDMGQFWKMAALNHTEISELTDVIKKQGFPTENDSEGKGKVLDDIGNEIADIIIRAMNFGVIFELDVEYYIAEKMKENFSRGYKYNTHEGGGADH